MDNPYSGELPKINKIAKDVQTVLEKISQLELQASNLQTQISQVPYQTDEDGYDVNEGQRNALYAQLDSVNSLIEEANEARHQLQSEAYALVSDYQSKISIFEKQAQKTAEAKASFDVLSGYRFGTRTAAAGSQLAEQRKTHYDDQVSVLRSLLKAAQNAANGILMTTTLQTISERGEFNDPKTIFYGNHLENNQRVNQQKNDLENNWSGIPGDSIKNTNDNIATSILGNLGMSGIPYHGGKPDFSNVSLAKVNTTISDIGMVAAADAMLAKEYGVTEDDIVSYRQENGLEWRDDGSGNNANLIPQNISQAFDEGREKQQEPTAMEALTAYMYAHNYGENDYDEYSKDPEWKRLHKAVFPEYHQIAEYELKHDEKVGWVQSVVPHTSAQEAERIVDSMEHYSDIGYKDIHNNSSRAQQEIDNILKIFDAKTVPIYKGRIYRGLSFDSKKELLDHLVNNNGIWDEPGITSFSADKIISKEQFAKDKKWGLVLTCKNNKSGIPFRHISKHSWEDEILSPGSLRNKGWTIDYESIAIDNNERIVYADIVEL